MAFSQTGICVLNGFFVVTQPKEETREDEQSLPQPTVSRHVIW